MFRSSGTPIAYSAVNKDTGNPRCLYRFVLADRNKEIAIGDIVKAPIPAQMSNVKQMKFNGLSAAKERDDDLQVITGDKLTSHYVGIVRYLGTSTASNGRTVEEVVTIIGIELVFLHSTDSLII